MSALNKAPRIGAGRCRFFLEPLGQVSRFCQVGRPSASEREAKMVLSGDWAKEKRTTPLEEQEFWQPLFEAQSKPDSREGRPVSRAMFEMSLPVSIEEHGRVLHSTHESSPGLDGVDRTVLRGIKPRIGVAHMNLWLLACRPPGLSRSVSQFLYPKPRMWSVRRNIV